MTSTDIFLMITLISILGIIIFTLFAIINFLRRNPSKDEWKKAFFFLGLSIVFFVLFGISLG